MSAPRPLSDLLPLVLSELEERRDRSAVASIFPLRLVDLPAERAASPGPSADTGEDEAWERIYSRAA